MRFHHVAMLIVNPNHSIMPGQPGGCIVWLGLLLGRLVSDLSVNVEGIKAWRVGLTASLFSVADLPYLN